MRILPAILTVLLSSICFADSVRSLDGKVYDGKASIDAAGIAIQPRGGQPVVKVPFSQLLRARFDSGTVDPNDSSEAWSAVDIGETPQPGSHKFNKNQLTVETAGKDVVGRSDSARLVYQSFRGTGEVSAKVTGAGQWRDRTAAGVMIRASTDPAAPSVALMLAKDTGLYLVVRPSGGFDTTVTPIGKMRAPMYLRLTRESNYVRAYRSADGKLWIRVGEAKVAMGDEPIAGAVAVSREPGMSAPVFESLRVACDDIKGATSIDIHEIRALVRTGRDEPRKDGQKNVKLNQLTMARGLPDASTAEMRFQLDGRYNLITGQAFVNDKERSGGSVTLQIFVDGEKLFDTGKITAEAGALPFNLPVAGKRELRMVAIDGGSGKLFNAAGFRNVAAITIKPGRATPRNQSAVIVATDGAVYAGVDLRRVSSERVEFSRGPRKDLSIAQADVAHILLPGFEPRMAEKFPASGSGVILANGDFYEGDIERFDAVGRVQVNSVIFGPREFNLKTEVAALVLRGRANDPAPAAYEVHVADGSVLPAASLGAEGSNLQVNDRHLGKLVIDARSVREIRYGGDRLKWVADLRPRRVSPGPGRSAAESFVIDATPLGPAMRLLDTDCERGVSLSTGTSVSYDLEGRFNTLLCVAGVPADVLPTTAVVFIIDTDGKQAFRSAPRTSVHDPLPITVDTTNVKTVTLRVEPASVEPVSTIALFGDPLLIKSSP